jgi:putative sterol carrier protein
MTTELDQAVDALKPKLAAVDIEGTYRFEIEDVGVIRIVDGELTTEDGDADVTIAAPMDVFREMFDGALSPTSAYMTGKITVDGDMSAAMKLSQMLG